MKKYILILLILIKYLSGYSQTKAVKETNITVTTFTKLPKEIDGCAGYFYLNTNDKKSDKYICVSDFALYAFITINNKTEKLKLLKTIKNGYLYSNDKYTLQIDILSKKPNSEGSDITGKITVTTKSSQRIEKAMVGYVGC